MRIVTVAGDDAGHVRAMAVVVVGRPAPVDEIDEELDARPPAPALGKVVVPRVDAGIDNGDADPASVVAVGGSGGAGANRLPRALEGAKRGTVVREAVDERTGGDERQYGVGNVDHDAVDDRQHQPHGCAELADERHDLREHRARDRADDDARASGRVADALLEHRIELVAPGRRLR